MARADAPITLIQVATPSQPSSGFSKLYPKSDGRWYTNSNSVAELPITPLTAKNTSDQASIGTTITDLTNLGITITSGTWLFRWIILYSTTSSSIGIQVAINGPTLTSLSLAVETLTASNGFRGDVVTAYNAVSGATTSGGATVLPVYMEGLVTVSASGTLQPRAQASAAGNTVTVKAASFGQVWAF
jgi:hypothetical protein